MGVTGFVLEQGAVELLKVAAWRSSYQHLRINLALALEPKGLARLMKRVNLTRLLYSFPTSQHFQVSVGRAIGYPVPTPKRKLLFISVEVKLIHAL